MKFQLMYIIDFLNFKNVGGITIKSLILKSICSLLQGSAYVDKLQFVLNRASGDGYTQVDYKSIKKKVKNQNMRSSVL